MTRPTEWARVCDREDPESIEDGLTSVEDIAHEMGITVSKWAKRAIQDGWLRKLGGNMP